MEISLLDFVRTGAFGSVKLGMTRQQVAACLHEPEQWSSETERAKSNIWKYNTIEIYFIDDIIWMIYCDDLTGDYSDSRVQLDRWILDKNLTLSRAEEEFTRLGIDFEKQGFPYSNNGVYLVTGSMVTMHFSGGDKQDFTLQDFHIR